MSASRFHILLILLASFAFFFELGRMDIVLDNEGQRATPPKEMLESGDFVVPTINDDAYLAKPPLLYWCIAGVYRITGGPTEFAARLPTALCGMAIVFLVYYMVRRDGHEVAARWAALGLMTSPYLLERARLAQLDVPFSLAVFGSILGLYCALRSGARGRSVLCVAVGGVAFGAALLLKGPPAFLFLWAAWGALLLMRAPDPGPVLRIGLWLTAGAFVLEWVAFGLDASGTYNLPLPAALLLAAVGWTVLALYHAGPHRWRVNLYTAWVPLIGVLIAAPWAVAVVNQQGWPYIQELLHEQVFERTHTASRINSGTPFYYLAALPFLCAPWGFLFPLLCARKQWAGRPAMFQFAAITAGLSILAFSLIAGKEYEYILPAFPFLLAATGHIVADTAADTALLRRSVLGACIVLACGAVGLAVYIAIEQPIIGLWIRAWPLLAGAVIAALLAWRRPTVRIAAVFAATLLVSMGVLLSRAYHYKEGESFRAISIMAGELVRQGYTVQASHVYPAMPFYASTRIPEGIDLDGLRAKVRRGEPCYVITREEWFEWIQADPLQRIEGLRVLSGPYRKDVILVGNEPLPETIAANNVLE